MLEILIKFNLMKYWNTTVMINGHKAVKMIKKIFQILQNKMVLL